jgi:hypothetical protein
MVASGRHVRQGRAARAVARKHPRPRARKGVLDGTRLYAPPATMTAHSAPWGAMRAYAASGDFRRTYAAVAS